MLHGYHEARSREDQWRVPQLLLALITPILTLASVLFTMGGNEQYGTISGAVALVTGTAAALAATQVTRWHRAAVALGNTFRDTYPHEQELL